MILVCSACEGGRRVGFVPPAGPAEAFGELTGRPLRCTPDAARLHLLAYRGPTMLATALVRGLAEDVEAVECPYCPQDRIVQLDRV